MARTASIIIGVVLLILPAALALFESRLGGAYPADRQCGRQDE